MKQEPALQNLFMFLVREGFPLGVRDYEDALKALRSGYGLNRREDLLRLCQTLWARTEEEKRFLDALFSQFERPTEEEVKKIIKPDDASFVEDTPPPPITGEPPRPERRKDSAQVKPEPTFEFTSPANRKGIGLPSAKIAPKEDEYFILSPRLLISLRRLTVIWRRFKAAKREGAKVELDIQATIEEKCRHGILSEPVLIPARRNQARLVVLVDVSASMIAWRDFNGVLVKSLSKGQLGKSQIYYFHNIPDDVLYESESLIKPKPVADALKENQNSALLIISDGGAARGYKNRERVKETEKFLQDVSRAWRPVVWLNPMPSDRWRNTTAEAIKKLLNNKMYRLNEEGMIKAIDVLRGKRVN